MKVRIAALILPLAFFALPAPAQPTLNVQKLGDGVWSAEADKGANVAWFVISDGVVVVDSGNDEATARLALEKIAETAGKPVRHLIITHAHGDHANGAAVFAAAGAEVICQENGAAAVASVLRRPAAAPSKPSAGVVAISDRLAFFGGSRRAAVYFLGPGHTNGDLIVLLPEEKILFSGDLVVNGRLPYLQSPDADPRGWEQILVRLAALDVDKVAPGHGKVGTRQSIADSLAYLRKVNELATLFIQTRVPDELYEAKLREPDNRITNVSVSPDHIANVRAAVKLELARLEKPAATPGPSGAKPGPTPASPKTPKKG
jgi:cyclase